MKHLKLFYFSYILLRSILFELSFWSLWEMKAAIASLGVSLLMVKYPL